MKILDEIKKEYAKENDCKSWRGLTQYDLRQQDVDNVAKRYALEACKEALRNASENAKTIRTAKDGSWSTISPLIRTSKALHYVDKQSILSEDNIPKELL